MRTLIALLAGCAAIVAAPAMAADAPAKAAAYKAPKTSFGQPDLEGYWTNATLTKLERDPKYGARRDLTKAEVDTIEGADKARSERINPKVTKEVAKESDLPECQSGAQGPACGYNAGWTDPRNTVMKVNGVGRTSFINFPEDGRIPARIAAPASAAAATAQARRRPAAAEGGSEGGEGDSGPARPGQNDNPEGRSLGERCIMSFGQSSGPVMQPQLYNNNYMFVQSKDSVAIWVEMVHDVRIVRLNQPHRTDSIAPWMGDSVGHWEGDTLVVDTTGYNPKQTFRGSDANLHMVEKFTRVGKNRLHYEFRVEDPTVWAQPWGGDYEFTPTSGKVYEYACHEGNYGLQNILAGAREEEAQAATKAKPTASR
jgi:hypothetical protein